MSRASTYGDGYNGLKLVNHGGKCCGIKTIYGFNCSPQSVIYDKCSPLNEIKINDKDSHGYMVSCNERFFTDSAPEESYRERLQRYIDFVKKRRPKQLIEVILQDSYQKAWQEELVNNFGFVKVNNFKNSNSWLWLSVFHLVIDEDLKPKKVPTEAVVDNFPTATDVVA